MFMRTCASCNAIEKLRTFSRISRPYEYMLDAINESAIMIRLNNFKSIQFCDLLNNFI